MTMHVYRSDFGWVIAADPADAMAVWLETTGERLSDYDGDAIEWVPLPDDGPLTVDNEDEGKRTQTCAEWATEMGRSCLGADQ